MSNNSYFVGDSYIGWNEDFTRVRLANRFEVIWMATSTLINLVSRLSLREDDSGCGVVYDTLFKEDIVYQKYREGILFQKGGTAIFFSYDVFEKLVINFDKAQIKEKGISRELTDNTLIEFGQDKVIITWQGAESIEYNFEEFATMIDNWKKKIKENKE